MQVIGIVGTAKNSGKTTTLTSILEEITKSKKCVALTSIGYEGEDLDNLTFLPKPRIWLEPETIVATASLALDTAKLKYSIIEKTNIETALGKIYIVKIEEKGKIVVAGPNNIADLNKIISSIEILSTELLFIDGAMNRMAPMYLTDKIIFATGASRNISVPILAEEMTLIDYLFKKELNNNFINLETIALANKENIIETGITALLDINDYNKLINFNPENYETIIMKTIFSANIMKLLCEKVLHKKEYNICFLEPFRLLLSINSFSLNEFYKIIPQNINVTFSIKPKLIAITVNPFYPQYENYSFHTKYINKEELKIKVSGSVSIPVYDVYEDGSNGIVDLILQNDSH
jgi:hypothetical protein